MDSNQLEELYQSKETEELLNLIKESHHLEEIAKVTLIKELKSRGVDDAQFKIAEHIEEFRANSYENQTKLSLIRIPELSGKILKYIKAGLNEDQIATKLEEDFIGYFKFKDEFYEDWLQLIRVCFTSLSNDISFSGDAFKAVVKSFNLDENEQITLIRYSRRKKMPIRILEMVILIGVGCFLIFTGLDEKVNWAIIIGIIVLILAALLYWWTFKFKIHHPITKDDLS